MVATWVYLSALIGSSQAPVAKTDTSSKSLLQDVAVLEATYKTLHPGLYRYNTPAQIDSLLGGLRKEFARDRTLADSYLVFSRFLAKIKCGHTYANFFNQPDEVAKPLFDQPNKVPFTFRWINKVMVVTKDFSSEQALPRGTEVLEIDGVATGKILSTLMAYARADGSNDAKRIADLEVGGASRYEAFDVFFPLQYPSSTNVYRLKIRKPKAKASETVSVAMIASDKRRNGQEKADPASPAWTLAYPKPDFAHLAMPTWAMYNRKWDWKTFLKQSFDELAAKSIPYLVIDLRGNEGGDSVGDAILPRLLKQRLATENYQRYTSYQTVPQNLRENLSTWDSSFFDWGKTAQPDPNGFYRLTRFGDMMGSVVSPDKAPYLGKVFVLVGPENSSATFEFASQIKRLKLGTLIGRPTGGNQRGINGGAFFFLSLPNSKIEVDVPLIAQFFPDARPDKGIDPDVFVTARSSDVAEGKDVELAKVLELIGKDRGR
ncbi:MAG: hypothetical protein JNK63_03960 [Chthonomonas sp.]|nr:hypothetical protein [Chthonomonas sp.]